MFKFLKNIFSSNNKSPLLTPRNLIGDYSVLKGIDESSFVHSDVVKMINRDLLILIIRNGFIVSPALIISFFKENYELTIDEFTILMFDIAMKCKQYILSDTLILEDAIKLNDGTFSEKSIEYFKSLLEESKEEKRKTFENGYVAYQKKLKEENEIRRTLGWKNIEADKLIDEWLSKKNKHD